MGPIPYFANLRRLRIRESSSDLSTTHSCDIMRLYCDLFMCFMNIEDSRLYYENSPNFTPGSFLQIWASAAFKISLSAIGLHLCAFYEL